MKNLLLLTDSYKVSHWKQYPPKTETIYSYFESRGGVFPATVFFGLQYFLKEYLQKPVTITDVNEAEKFFGEHFGTTNFFNKQSWLNLINKHKGRLPISIKAVPEGTLVNTHNVLMTIENTDPEFFWLTNYLETLLVQVWYPTTVATLSYYCKQLILKYAEETGNPPLVDFKLHDFGFRGVSSVESALTGGMSHILNFKGTDTIAALYGAKKYYKSPVCPAYSIPAAEHSTIVSWGKEHELDAYENMLKQYPEGLVACVSDSYDIYNACENLWGEILRGQILKRPGCLVIRPDSGYPPEIVVKVLEILGEKFGYSVNAKGYKVLNEKVRVIQGDGVDYEMIDKVLDYMKIGNWSTDNIAFGMGGALLQKLNRDTQKFAFKCSAIEKDGEWHDVCKTPITDTGKLSKKGKLKLIPATNDKEFTTVNQNVPTGSEDVLVEVYRNGKILVEHTFQECQARLYPSLEPVGA